MRKSYNSERFGLIVVQVISFQTDNLFTGEILYIERSTITFIRVGYILNNLDTAHWKDCPSPTKIEIPLTL